MKRKKSWQTKKQTSQHWITFMCATLGSVNFCKWKKEWNEEWKRTHKQISGCNALIYCCHYRYLALIQQTVAVSLAYNFFFYSEIYSRICSNCMLAMILVWILWILLLSLPIANEENHKVCSQNSNYICLIHVLFFHFFKNLKCIQQFFISVAFLAIAFPMTQTHHMNALFRHSFFFFFVHCYGRKNSGRKATQFIHHRIHKTVTYFECIQLKWLAHYKWFKWWESMLRTYTQVWVDLNIFWLHSISKKNSVIRLRWHMFQF